MKNLFLIIVFLGLSFNSYASYSVCEIKGEVINRAIYNSSQITKQEACEFGQHVESLLRPVLKNFDFAPKVSLQLMPELDNASYDNGTMIKLPIKFYSLDLNDEKVFKEQKALDAIILHEYGHAVLARYLVINWASFRDYSSSGHRISELEQQNLIAPSKEIQEKINYERKTLMSSRSMRTFTKAITPYQELFADILSAFELNDKDAILNAITTLNDTPDNYLLYLGRSFSNKELDLGRLSTFPHSYFYKTRQFIGLNFWPINELDKKEKLKKLIKIIQEELEISSYNSYFTTEPLLDNELLIDRIAQILK